MMNMENLSMPSVMCRKQMDAYIDSKFGFVNLKLKCLSLYLKNKQQQQQNNKKAPKTSIFFCCCGMLTMEKTILHSFQFPLVLQGVQTIFESHIL